MSPHKKHGGENAPTAAPPPPTTRSEPPATAATLQKQQNQEMALHSLAHQRERQHTDGDAKLIKNAASVGGDDKGEFSASNNSTEDNKSPTSATDLPLFGKPVARPVSLFKDSSRTYKVTTPKRKDSRRWTDDDKKQDQKSLKPPPRRPDDLASPKSDRKETSASKTESARAAEGSKRDQETSSAAVTSSPAAASQLEADEKLKADLKRASGKVVSTTKRDERDAKLKASVKRVPSTAFVQRSAPVRARASHKTSTMTGVPTAAKSSSISTSSQVEQDAKLKAELKRAPVLAAPTAVEKRSAPARVASKKTANTAVGTSAAKSKSASQEEQDARLKASLKRAPVLAGPAAVEKRFTPVRAPSKTVAKNGEVTTAESLIAVGIPAVTTSKTSSQEEQDSRLKASLKRAPAAVASAPASRAKGPSTARTQQEKDAQLKASLKRAPSLAAPIGKTEGRDAGAKTVTNSGLIAVGIRASKTESQEEEDARLKASLKRGPSLAAPTSALSSSGARKENSTQEEKDTALKASLKRAPSLAEPKPATQQTNTQESDAALKASLKRTPSLAAPTASGAINGEPCLERAASDDGSVLEMIAEARSMSSDEQLKCKNSGPSLATAVSGEIQPGAFSVEAREKMEKQTNNAFALSVDSVQPGAFAVRETNDDEKDSNGLAVPLAGGEENSPNGGTSGGGLVAINHEEIEAQAGLPVIFPGAFAIEGVDNSSGHESSSLQDSLSTIEVVDMEEEEPYVPETLQATLAEEPELVDEGQVHVVSEDEDYDPKLARRVRMMQGTTILLSFAAIAMVVVSVTGGFSQSTSPPKDPTIEGWLQAGEDIFGPTEEAQTMLGSAIAVSENGKRIVAAAPGADDGINLNVGEVYIFDEVEGPNGTEWKTADILPGLAATESADVSIAISADAQKLAVGYSQFSGGLGRVQFYVETGFGWAKEQLFANRGEEELSWFGHAVDLSSDGAVLAIGAPLMSTHQGVQSGAVRVFQKRGSNWTQVGGDIVGDTENEFSGWSVALRPSDGFRVAIGAPVGNSDKGLVRVFDWNGYAWEQVGDTIPGAVPLGRFGESLDLSRDGSILAVGAMGTAFEKGQVQVFREVDGTWVPDLKPILGEDVGEGFGSSVALSRNGAIMAIGAPYNDEFGEDSGRIKVLEFNERSRSWIQQGSNIGGFDASEYGFSVGLSGDGSRVAGGAPSMVFDERVERVGATRVYDRVE